MVTSNWTVSDSVDSEWLMAASKETFFFGNGARVVTSSDDVTTGIFASAEGPHRSPFATTGIRTGAHTVGTHVYYPLSPPTGFPYPAQSVFDLSARTPCRGSLVRSPAVWAAV
ncbi:unnamed protein product [Albugo candida]|uniref:Uncharacterized protein n=1 Tax=Albugo candida TaxID=65357 RepID=A0A024FUM5_9STRA|nr:unnamed protein product [Albugo candida]|eukprot:CCI10853.1 unnamed protein product [Albugo candida]